MSDEKSAVISNIVSLLLEDNETAAKALIQQEYPHTQVELEKRTYTMAQKMNQFLSDGFIDRYSGQKLLNPGILKILSHYFPEEFPYHPHWKMTHTHIAYWELTPKVGSKRRNLKLDINVTSPSCYRSYRTTPWRCSI